MIDEKEADAYNARHADEAQPEDITELTAIAQAALKLPIDGKLGTGTRAALGAARASRHPAPVAARIEAVKTTLDVGWGETSPPWVIDSSVRLSIPPRPRSYAEAARLWGVPAAHFSGAGADEAWERANLVELHGDGGTYPGLLGNRHFYLKVHRKIVPHLQGAWAQALRTSEWAKKLASEDPDRGLRTGGYVYRTIRNRGKNLSPHGLGLAADVRPDLNPGKDVRRGDAPIAFSPAWFAMFPGSMDREFVQAFRDHGFTWGADWDQDGRTDDEIWLDLMHFEWIDRTGGKPRSEPGQT